MMESYIKAVDSTVQVRLYTTPNSPILPPPLPPALSVAQVELNLGFVGMTSFGTNPPRYALYNTAVF
jgi:hypothetical protein